MLVIFKIRSCFTPQLAWTSILLFVLPHIAGVTGTHYSAQSLIYKGGVLQAFCPGWPQAMILPTSVSQVARLEPPYPANICFSNHTTAKNPSSQTSDLTERKECGVLLCSLCKQKISYSSSGVCCHNPGCLSAQFGSHSHKLNFNLSGWIPMYCKLGSHFN
jgi:hypothetical protein